MVHLNELRITHASNLTFTFVGVLFGGLITWFYYKRSGNELATEAARLQGLLTIILNAMEDSAFVKLNRDHSGEIKGRVIPLSATLAGGTQMFGELQVLKATGDSNQVTSRTRIVAR